ncbi:MAG: hypothetical protein J7527_15640 [Chitinophagaceae bacterium]|nr:hypothetical protein [Chitinophagaceae bacterium]
MTESENIFKDPNGNTVIMNGGDPLPGCPTSWEEAYAWMDRVNGERYEKNGSCNRPMWSWDCGFKLDYDGPLFKVCSRFYPPKSHYGATWDGAVFIMFREEEILEKKFDCPSLEDLRKEVEEFVAGIEKKILSALKSE